MIGGWFWPLIGGGLWVRDVLESDETFQESVSGVSGSGHEVSRSGLETCFWRKSGGPQEKIRRRTGGEQSSSTGSCWTLLEQTWLLEPLELPDGAEQLLAFPDHVLRPSAARGSSGGSCWKTGLFSVALAVDPPPLAGCEKNRWIQSKRRTGAPGWWRGSRSWTEVRRN